MVQRFSLRPKPARLPLLRSDRETHVVPRLNLRLVFLSACVSILAILFVHELGCRGSMRRFPYTRHLFSVSKENWYDLPLSDGAESAPSLAFSSRMTNTRTPGDMSFSNSGYFRKLRGLCDEECCKHPPTGRPRRNKIRRLQDSLPLPSWLSYVLAVVLVCFSALFSGLTLGLMALDKNGLEIVMAGEDAVAAKNARKIYPVRKNGNLLLCTLLLGNVAVNALLSILMADIAGGLVGFLVSTALLVVFGEIIPQAVCSRYALAIGSRAVPIVKVIICLVSPIAYPLSWVLNKLLGHELGTIYSKAEMRKLLEIHAERGGFDKEMASAMTGALKYQDVKVSEVMTLMNNTFMLSVDELLSYETIVAIFKTGYSRIPVYEGKNRNNVIGLLFVKDLIFVDPEEETPLRTFVRVFSRGLHVVWPDDSLGDVLRELKQGRSHMALVRDVNNDDPDQDPFYEIRGIITLEDIIEVILGDEIVDETDEFTDHTRSTKVDREFDWDRLRALDTKLVDKRLTSNEEKAVAAFLRANYDDVVSLLTDNELNKMVSSTFVTEIEEETVDGESPDEANQEEILYERGVKTDVCTLILSGKVKVYAGKDEFQSDSGAWSVLAKQALTDSNYAPDFTAAVSGGSCRCLRFSRERFIAAVDASTAEKSGLEGGSGGSGYIEKLSASRSEDEQDADRAYSDGVLFRSASRRSSNSGVFVRKSRRSKLLAAFHSKVSEKGLQRIPSSIAAGASEKSMASSSSSNAEEIKSLKSKLTGAGAYAPKKRSSQTMKEHPTKNGHARGFLDYIGGNGTRSDESPEKERCQQLGDDHDSPAE